MYLILMQLVQMPCLLYYVFISDSLRPLSEENLGHRTHPSKQFINASYRHVSSESVLKNIDTS